jgi:SulP family sulfate permease
MPTMNGGITEMSSVERLTHYVRGPDGGFRPLEDDPPFSPPASPPLPPAERPSVTFPEVISVGLSSLLSPMAPPPSWTSRLMAVREALKQMVLRFIFLRHWLKGYRLGTFKLDLLAGLTVGVIVIPQSMAYATLAGLPPIAGLYSSLTPLVVYGLLGSCGQLAVGPTAIHAIITAEFVLGELTAQGADHMAVAGALALYSGLLRVVLGLADMGFLANFLSSSVTSGFTSAAGLMIVFSQIRSLTGLTIPRGRTIFQVLYNTATSLPTATWSTAASVAMGTTVLVFLTLIKKVRRLPKWFPSQLIALVACTLVTWLFKLNTAAGIKILETVPAGFPPPTLPVLDPRSPLELYLQPVAVITAMAFMESISLGQRFSRERGYQIDPSQELFAMGMANALGSLFGGFPITGSFGRSIVSAHVGAVTPLSNIPTALVVAAALSFLTPVLYYLPSTCLAGIIISSAWALVEFGELAWLWRHRLPDRVVWLSAFLATLGLGVGPGAIVGVAISFAALIQATATPHTCVLGRVKEDWRDLCRFPNARPVPNVTVLRIDAQLSFTNAAYVRRKIEAALAQWPETRCLAVDCRAVNGCDATAVHMLEDLATALKDRTRPVLLVLAYIKGPFARYIAQLYDDPANAKLMTFTNTNDAVEWGTANLPVWPGDAEKEPVVDFSI